MNSRQCGLAVILCLHCVPLAAQEASIIVTVDGHAITTADVEAMMVSRQIPAKLRSSVKSTFVERLIDDHLLRKLLASRKVTAPKELVDRAVSRVYRQIRKQGGKPAEVLKQRGLDEVKLRRELSLGIAWQLFARQIVSKLEIKQRFNGNRPAYDGTRIRASQIVLKLPADDAGKKQALQMLKTLRGEIAAGKTTFADAAKKHSVSPSAKAGGDLGFFAYRGKMPLAMARKAFGLKDGEMSEPFLTSFGVHLLKVTERKPGQLSLEDARPEIFQQIARERRREIVQRLRKSAKIMRPRE